MSKRSKKPSRRNQIPARPSPIGPNKLAPTARDVPRIRQRMLDWAEDRTRFGAAGWLGKIGEAIVRAKPGEKPEEWRQSATMTSERWATTLRTGELFYVAEALTTLTRHAAESLTGYDLHPEDLPAETGVMFYADPLRDTGAPDPGGLPITLITWAIHSNSVLIDFWTPTSHWRTPGTVGFLIPGFAHLLNDNRHRLPKHAVPQNPLPTHGFLFQRSVALPFGAPVDADHISGQMIEEHECTGEGCQVCYYADLSRDTTRLQKLIVATWLLMGQTITLETPLEPKPLGTGARPRPDAPPQLVRYIELRAVKRPPRPQAGDEPSRIYKHSWVVRGHWRSQWYPSREAHRPLWIGAHVAGPDDAPLIGGDRINILRR
jgi:hypothetical protein